MRGNSPSPRPSPRKRGEGEVERTIVEVWAKLHDPVIARSERDDAIHSLRCALDCFACARNDGFNGLRLSVGTRVSHFWVNCGRRDAYSADRIGGLHPSHS